MPPRHSQVPSARCESAVFLQWISGFLVGTRFIHGVKPEWRSGAYEQIAQLLSWILVSSGKSTENDTSITAVGSVPIWARVNVPFGRWWYRWYQLVSESIGYQLDLVDLYPWNLGWYQLVSRSLSTKQQVSTIRMFDILFNQLSSVQNPCWLMLIGGYHQWIPFLTSQYFMVHDRGMNCTLLMLIHQLRTGDPHLCTDTYWSTSHGEAWCVAVFQAFRTLRSCAFRRPWGTLAWLTIKHGNLRVV